MAQVDFFLKIEGANFDSQSAIQIESFSWGASNSSPAGSGSGGGAGKVSVHDISIMKVVDKVSPALFAACCSGKHIANAELSFYKRGTPQSGPPNMSIKLIDCLVTSVKLGGGRHTSSIGVEAISLNFSKIEYNYKPSTTDVDVTTGGVSYFTDPSGAV